MKILVVDNDATYFKKVEASVAEKAGIDACYASSAEEAWALLAEESVSLMVVNPAVAETNGNVLAAMVRGAYPDVTVVIRSDAGELQVPSLSGGEGASRFSASSPAG